MNQSQDVSSCSGSFVEHTVPSQLVPRPRAHQSQVWPRIPAEVPVNELWASNTTITSHKSSNSRRTRLHEKDRPRRSSQSDYLHQDVGVNIWNSEEEVSKSSNYLRCGRGRGAEPVKPLTVSLCLCLSHQPINPICCRKIHWNPLCSGRWEFNTNPKDCLWYQGWKLQEKLRKVPEMIKKLVGLRSNRNDVGGSALKETTAGTPHQSNQSDKFKLLEDLLQERLLYKSFYIK